jgi:hypothetical protein
MKKALACFLFLFPVLANAAAPKLRSAGMGGPSNEIYVEFELKDAPKDCAVEFPAPATCPAVSEAPWTVVVYDSVLHPSVFEVVSSVIANPPFGASGSVTLTLKQNVPSDFKRIDVTFNQPDYSHVSIDPKQAVTAPPVAANAPAPTGTTPAVEPASKPKKSSIEAAKTKDESNVYLSGTFSPAVGSSPDYSTDSKVNWPVYYFDKPQSWALALAAIVQTDSKGSADPDGFSWGVPIQYVSSSQREKEKGNLAATLWNWPSSNQWSVVGMELDKRGKALNFVSAPSITRGFYHDFYGLDKKRPGLKAVKTSVGLDLTAGVEFGGNLRQDFPIKNRPGEQEGAIFRGVPSATADLVIPNVLHLSKITLSSSYTARIPTTDELFLETRNTKNPIPLMSSQTRHWVQNSLQFNITDFVAIQIKHQYGTLPPAFSFVQNSGSIGLVYAFKKVPPKPAAH